MLKYIVIVAVCVIGLPALIVGMNAANAITDVPHPGVVDEDSTNAPDAGAQSGSGIDVQSVDASGDATALSADATSSMASDADSETFDLELTPSGYVFGNMRIPQKQIDALSCTELKDVHDAIWGRHGFNFPDAKKRERFAVLHPARYVPLAHVTEDTIRLFLTSNDNLNLMLLGRASYQKGCHRSTAP